MLYVLYYLRGHYAESFVYFSHLVSSCLYHACDQVFFQYNCNHHYHYCTNRATENSAGHIQYIMCVSVISVSYSRLMNPERWQISHNRYRL